jgi:hypothetical protein
MLQTSLEPFALDDTDEPLLPHVSAGPRLLCHLLFRLWRSSKQDEPKRGCHLDQ